MSFKELFKLPHLSLIFFVRLTCRDMSSFALSLTLVPCVLTDPRAMESTDCARGPSKPKAKMYPFILQVDSPGISYCTTKLRHTETLAQNLPSLLDSHLRDFELSMF